MKKKFFYFLLSLIFISNFIYGQLPAFPGAEGFGALASGGRGGSVYHVTNLNDTGKGSLRDAVSQPNRTVVFNVGGIIKVKDRIAVKSNITIAGQTAPGDGIVVYGYGMTFSHEKNVIVRYIKIRGGVDMPKGKCTLTADSAENMIFDHVSVQWGRWDNLHIEKSNNITMQYCIIGESIDPQRFGALLERPKTLTVHHCLWIDNQSRNPKAKAEIEYINNVVYNWGQSGLVGGHSAEQHYQDVINNYFIAGPNSTNSFLAMFTATDHVYQTGNVLDLNKDGILNGRAVSDSDFIFQGASLTKQKQLSPKIPVTIDSPENAYAKVILSAGASIQRDAVDERLIGYVKTLGKEGKIFKTEADAGGQPPLKEDIAKKDSDEDGIPDEWEVAHKLNKNSNKDGNIVTASGYTNLELYVNQIASVK